MTEKLTKAHRLIDRENILREGGQEPQSQSVEKTIAFLTDDELLPDERVREYLLHTSERYFNDYFIVQRLLATIIPLVQIGFSDQAAQVYKKLARYDDPRIWYSGRVWGASIISKTLFTTVIGFDRLLIDGPETWGAIAVSMLDRFLLEAQRSEWPDWVKRHDAIAGSLGGELLDEGAFQARHDDPLWSYHYRFDRDQRRGTPHILVASTIEKALREACLDDAGMGFSKLADHLIGSKWSLAISLPLLLLCESLKAEQVKPWHVEEAARLLTQPQVEQQESTTHLRRLLRRALPASTPQSDRERIVQTIREGAPDPDVRIAELSDVRNWGVLTEEEEGAIREAETRGEITPPSDPRRRFEDVTWSRGDAEPSRLANEWPHVEQRALLNLLHSSPRTENTKSTREEMESGLPPKLEALRVLTEEPEAVSPNWKWRFVDWAEQALTALRRLALFRTGRDPSTSSLSLAEYRALLTSEAPWWPRIAEWAFEGLDAKTSESERSERPTAMLSWGSSDPIPASLAFLDELLAIGDGEPFDVYRERLGATVSRHWDGWSAYTRAIALLVLRDYHWHRVSLLSERADAVWDAETDPNLLLRCLDFVLARSGVAARLSTLLARLSQMSGAKELASRVGNVIGDATVRSRGERGTHPELAPVAALGDNVLNHPDQLGTYASDVVQGIVWGAYERIRSLDHLDFDLANCWGDLAERAMDVALNLSGGEDRLEGTIQALMSVLECRWPNELRASLYSRLLPVLERLLREATLGDFAWLHYQLGRELEGKIDGNEDIEGQAQRELLHLAPTDEVLVRLCHASAERVRTWARGGTTTDDVGWISALKGRDTANLIRQVFRFGRDKGYLQRSLPPAIDILGEAGYPELAAELRLVLRRG